MAWDEMESNGMYFAKKDISNKLMIFRSARKNPSRILPFDGKRSSLKRIRVATQGKRVVEVGILLIGNDKNNVIVDKVLSYFGTK